MDYKYTFEDCFSYNIKSHRNLNNGLAKICMNRVKNSGISNWDDLRDVSIDYILQKKGLGPHIKKELLTLKQRINHAYGIIEEDEKIERFFAEYSVRNYTKL